MSGARRQEHSAASRKHDESSLQGLGWMIVGAALCALLCWLVPSVVTLEYRGRLSALGFTGSVRSAIRLIGAGAWANPAEVYPPETRELMPTAVAWWLAAGTVPMVACGLLAGLIRRFEPMAARERLGRRAYEWAGSRPRAWGRPRDLRTGRRRANGFSLGRLDGRAVTAEEEHHVALIAPTRAGKTTRCVIPWLLEHEGPAIVTSTKRDVLEATTAWRKRTGQIWIFDPFGENSMSWTPVAGCESWTHALQQAQWLADASAEGDSEIARYWRGEAAKLLAPLLHAAALDGSGILDVLGWVDTQDLKRPAAALLAANAIPAARQLQSVAALDGRNKGTTYMSAGSVLSAYRYPAVHRSIDDDFRPLHFLTSAADTLFLVAAERHQRLLAPLVVTLLSSVINEAVESGTFASDGRRLRILLDEAANIAPMPELPRLLSQAAGHGIRVATVWQSIAQMEDRHGGGAATILANSATKLFMGPITDDPTRNYLGGLLGRAHGGEGDRPREKAPATALQQLNGDRVLCVSGERIPAMLTVRPYWARRR